VCCGTFPGAVRNQTGVTACARSGGDVGGDRTSRRPGASDLAGAAAVVGGAPPAPRVPVVAKAAVSRMQSITRRYGPYNGYTL